MSLEERFGTVKPVIAMVHFPALQGRPRHDRDAGRTRLLAVADGVIVGTSLKG